MDQKIIETFTNCNYIGKKKKNSKSLLWFPQPASHPGDSAAAPGCLAAGNLWTWQPCRWQHTTKDAQWGKCILSASWEKACRCTHFLHTCANSSRGVTTPFLVSWISFSSWHIVKVSDPGWSKWTPRGSCSHHSKSLSNKTFKIYIYINIFFENLETHQIDRSNGLNVEAPFLCLFVQSLS